MHIVTGSARGGRIAWFLLVALLGGGCGPMASAPTRQALAPVAARSAPAAPVDDHGRLRRPYRMLFIGNSLTSVNDLPGTVMALSKAAGDDPPLEAESVTFGGYALEDHLAQGDAARAIARGGWDVVVLQQGPSTLPESRANLIQYAEIFAALIRAAGARPALYGVWPEKERINALDDGVESYRQAAVAVDGMLFPVARAWKLAWQRDGRLPLYGPDGFHPSALGTYLAALVVYATVRDKSPVGLPSELVVDGRRMTIPATQAALAQQVAQAVTGTKKRPGKPWILALPAPGGGAPGD